MSKYLIDEIGRTSNIKLEARTEVVEAFGDEHLEGLELKGPEGLRKVPASSLFVFIGAAPNTDWLPSAVLRDEHGFVLAGPDLRSTGKLPEGWHEQREPFLLESRRCAPRIDQAGGVRGRRRVDRGTVRAPVSGRVLTGFLRFEGKWGKSNSKSSLSR
jgi:thioredoxin reductase (NADPH)